MFAFFVYSNLLRPTPAQWRHFEKIGRGIKNNDEPILDGVLNNALPVSYGSLALQPTVGHYEIAATPLLTWHLDRVVDKVTLSAFRKLTGCRAPDGGAVWHAWLTNLHILNGDLHKIPAQLFGSLDHIRQGRKTSQGQFAFQHRRISTGDVLFRFVFQNTVVLLSAVFLDPKAAAAKAAANNQEIDLRFPLQAPKPKSQQLVLVSRPNLVLRPVRWR